MMNLISYAAVVLLVAFLFGCGHQESPPGRSDPAAKRSSQASTSPADQGFDTPSCPSSLTNASRPVEGPVGDIRGLRIGTSVDDAINYIECLDPGATFARSELTNNISAGYSGQHVRDVRSFIELDTGVPGTTRGFISATNPYQKFQQVTERYQLLSFGEPQHEIVYGVWREQLFQEGKYPAVETVTAELKAKYGDDPQSVEKSNDGVRLIWKYDPEEHAIAKANPNFRDCSITTSIPVSAQWADVCGLTIGAEISTRGGNKLLANALTVGMIEQARLMKATKELGAKWKAADEARKQAEAETAKKVAPSL